jgi:hypothetical protein
MQVTATCCSPNATDRSDLAIRLRDSTPLYLEHSVSRTRTARQRRSAYQMAPKGGNTKQESGRAKKAANEAQKKAAAETQKVCLSQVSQ